MEITNLGNVKAENVQVQFEEEGQVIETQTFDIGLEVLRFYSGIGSLWLQVLEI